MTIGTLQRVLVRLSLQFGGGHQGRHRDGQQVEWFQTSMAFSPSALRGRSQQPEIVQRNRIRVQLAATTGISCNCTTGLDRLPSATTSLPLVDMLRWSTGHGNSLSLSSPLPRFYLVSMVNLLPRGLGMSPATAAPLVLPITVTLVNPTLVKISLVLNMSRRNVDADLQVMTQER